MSRVAWGCLLGIAWVGCNLDREPSGDGSAADLSSAVFSVGSDGTSRSWPDGSGIDIPAGALTERVAVGFRAMDQANIALPELPAGFRAASAVYACTPHGQQFQQPVRLTMLHDAGTVEASILTLAGPDDDTWRTVVAGVEMSESAVTLTTNHFSFFVVVQADNGPDEPGCIPGIDGDCYMCGNGVLEPGENCEAGTERPCPTECDDGVRCTQDLLVSSGLCNVSCVHTSITGLEDGDACCPPSGTPGTDSDCTGHCGDGFVDEQAGETCEAAVGDGCPRACDDADPCTNDVFAGSAGNCNATCTHSEITTPISGDQCCPQGANANTDRDCDPVCGNSATEAGEECDGDCRSEADCRAIARADPCLTAVFTGSERTCDAVCDLTLILDRNDGDGCCPPGANSSNDNDCAPQCGDGIVQDGEICDGDCRSPEECVGDDPCFPAVFVGSASTCDARCEIEQIVEPNDGDGCCPEGIDAADDNDCEAPEAVCGDETVDEGQGETCDIGLSPEAAGSCPEEADCLREDGCGQLVVRDPDNPCTAECIVIEAPSDNGVDGCCPDPEALQDPDCAALLDGGE